MENFNLTAVDGKKIYVTKWTNVKEPKGVVQIIHGMQEYAGRYELFASFLNENGYIVYADDHRGHGKTDENALGVCSKDVFNKTLSDQIELSKRIKSEHAGLPLFILGHSFGSFIAQRYIQETNDLAKAVILSGTAYQKNIFVKIGRAIAKINCLFCGELAKANFINKMAFGAYDNKFKSENIAHAWLTSERNIVELYNNDKFDIFIPSIGFFLSMFDGFKQMHKAKNMNKIRKDLPIFIASGNLDPVGNYGKAVKKLYDVYVENGLNNTVLKLYENARHEILNEKCRDMVSNDILNFINLNNSEFSKGLVQKQSESVVISE